MPDPSGFFFFLHVDKSERGVEKRYAFAYKPPGPLPRGALEDLMLVMCKGPCLPDAAIVISLSEDDSINLLDELKTESFRIAQQRLASRIPLLHVNLELKTGRTRIALLDLHFKSQESKLKKVVEKGIEGWIKSGLCTIFDPNEVILRAPAGYMYEKPSGARSELFLKPDLALKSSAIVSFVALSIFRRFFSGKANRFTDLHTLYVDTMAVSSVAYALRELLGLCGLNQAPHIESFHSYGGFEEVRRPLRGTSFCIISASTSMSLHRKWIAAKQAPADEVVTLLTLESAGASASGALLAIESPDCPIAPGPIQLSIRIKGETFLPEQEPPKKVLLGDPAHRSDQDVKHFHRFSGKKVFDVYRRPPKSSSKPRALYVDGEKLVDQPEFRAWMGSRLLQSAKAATRCIVYQDDQASRSLAGRIGQFCTEQLGLGSPRLVSTMELADAAFDQKDGVIVCAAVAGKGSQLLEVSRTLRDKHEGPRLYLIGFQVAEARSELNTLESNLKHSKDIPHEVARFGKAAIGTTLGMSFSSEQSAYYKTSSDLAVLPRQMRERAITLGSATVNGSLVLLPSGRAVDTPMSLRAGFAFWPKDYEPHPCQPEVLATIAVLLQRAREDKLPDDRRLAATSFRHVVLDPENFTRYNDGVIQSALLRCAYPSELDYRGDHASSDFVKALILRSLDRATSETGESILEFMLALAQRRLQLSERHFEDVRTVALSKFSRSSNLGKAVGFLLSGPQTGLRRRTKLPF